MTAQPHEYPAGPVERPRTVGAVRKALPPALRAPFQAALDAAEPAELFALVGQWAAVAQTAGDPEATVAAAAVRSGGLTVHDLGDVFPALAELR
ncbi:hypothetical protein [Streptacidiphilus carbonis]|uniref:hypothetical protein n=1 Tax=Streptacidiphilus carbonis TaxID=105422 RepID=UPI0005AAD3C0|nr:hypothetical protein [Streptacidiphilus carbonis]